MSAPWKREEVIGPCRLLLGDCRAILPTLSGIDAIVSDPPYGIGYKHSRSGKPVSCQNDFRKSLRFQSAVIGDDEPFDPASVLALGVPCVLFGANHFYARLPDGGTFHVWDKHCGRGTDDSFSDVEFVWTSWRCKSRVFRYLWKGMLQDGEKGEGKYHVSQKPIVVMAECLKMLPKATTICDPYMGSGSTGLACIRLGRRFVGIEIDEGHFTTACRRIERELRQGCLLRSMPEPPKPEQTSLLDVPA